MPALDLVGDIPSPPPLLNKKAELVGGIMAAHEKEPAIEEDCGLIGDRVCMYAVECEG